MMGFVWPMEDAVLYLGSLLFLVLPLGLTVALFEHSVPFGPFW